MLKRFWLRQCRWVRVIIIFCLVLIASGAYYVKSYASYLLSPGELSTMQSNNEMLGGVKSHAELERQCSHCHAPIHCVTDSRCQDCHFEIEQDRLDVNTIHGRLPGVTKCQTCHPEHQGHDADLTVFAFPNIDHYAMTGFSIEAHVTNIDGKKFTCTTCHTKVRDIIETIDCVHCHSTENHDDLAAHIEEYGIGCVQCHDGQDRMIVGFDHEPFFALQDGHQDIACADCHTEKQYVGIGTTCSNCHGEPELHAGVFGTSCDYCHTAQAWSPAVLTRHTFELKHGDEEIDTCETCHGGNYTEYPCYTCHENEDMVVAHDPLGIFELSNCIECHPTGRGKAIAPGLQTGETRRIGIYGNGSATNDPEIIATSPIFFNHIKTTPFQYQYKRTPQNQP